MHLLQRRHQLLAASLAGLAGFADAVGFLGMGGFFVSFMSGNSTRMGVGVASEAAAAAIAGSLVAAFLLGVVLGSLLSRRVGRRWQMPAVLALVAVALALGALLFRPGAVPGAFLFVALAMGALNIAFQREGEVAFGLTYMTGPLVRIGQRLADALAGGPRWGWLPWAGLWAGLVAGGVLGALAWLNLGMAALWIAAVAAALISLLSAAAPPSLAG
jgi:uncharacterized membrane protein YoaK (UPF0700 family)